VSSYCLVVEAVRKDPRGPLVLDQGGIVQIGKARVSKFNRMFCCGTSFPLAAVVERDRKSLSMRLGRAFSWSPFRRTCGHLPIFLCLLLTFFSGCGREPDTPITVDKGLKAAVTAALGSSDPVPRFAGMGLLTLEGVRSLTASEQSVDPASVPEKDAGVRTITYRAKITLEVESDESFTYASDAWGLRLTDPGASTRSQVYRLKGEDTKLEILSDPFPSDTDGSGRVLTGRTDGLIELRINLDDNDWEKIYDLSSQPEGLNPRRILVELFYDIFGDRNVGSDGYESVDTLFMQNDIGLIRAPTQFRVVGSSSGALTLEFSGPNDTTAVLPSVQYSETSAPSQLSGYLIMYWKEGDCEQSGWVFQSNTPYRVDAKASDPSLSCTYGGFDERSSSGGDSCQLGCGSSESLAYFQRAEGPRITDEDVAVPLENGACYKVARVAPGRKTFPLTGLENNVRYTMIAWPLDSSGTPGLTRSSCVNAVPVKVPLASAEKSDAPETVSDCFVATASSGGTASIAVHYWRILRDRWLDPLGLSRVYYRHAPSWAKWLRGHKSLQPVVHYVLTQSGAFLVDLDRNWLKAISWIREQWHQISAQLSTEALAAETAESSESDDDDLPASKALPSREEMAGDLGTEEQRSKSLPSADADGELGPRTKDLPQEPIGSASDSGDGSVATKSLPPALAEEESLKEESLRHPPESSSATLRIGGGVLLPSETEIWDRYYPVDQPSRFFIQSTLRLLDASGEWGLGLMVSLQSHSGRVPSVLGNGSPVNEDVAGRRIGYYSGGVYALTDYRLRYMRRPYVAPRFQFAFGAERLRETAAGQVSSGSSKETGRSGYTLWKPVAVLGVCLEVSFLALFGQGFYDSIHGYGAEDFLLSFDGAYALDLSGHGFSQTGLQIGGAIVMLLE
jgi:hypothetical protein